MEEDIKLNLGSGKAGSFPGFKNVDIRKLEGVDIVADVRKLPLKDNSVSEIISKNLIEHFGRHEILPLLKEWHRVLKPQGKITIETVDMGGVMDNWKNIPTENLLDAICGAQTYLENFHKMAFTQDILTTFLKGAGFSVETWNKFEMREIPRMTLTATK